METTVDCFHQLFRSNLAAARAGTLGPLPDHAFDKCRCGAVRGQHIGQNDTCPASRADSTETFRQ